MQNKKWTIFPIEAGTKEAVASVTSTVQAGFPSPAEDYLEAPLNLHDYVVKNPPATFFVKVAGESMVGARIEPGDILVVDRSLEPSTGKIVVAILNGEFTVKRIRMEGHQVMLEAENPAFPDIHVPPEADFEVWGVVTYVVHKA